MGWLSKKDDAVSRMETARDESRRAADKGDKRAAMKALREFNEAFDAASPAERKRAEKSARKNK